MAAQDKIDWSECVLVEVKQGVQSGAPVQGVGGDKIGYSREISAVGHDFIMRHYQEYDGVKPVINHLGIDDASMVHYFYRGKWIGLTGAD